MNLPFRFQTEKILVNTEENGTFEFILDTDWMQQESLEVAGGMNQRDENRWDSIILRNPVSE